MELKSLKVNQKKKFFLNFKINNEVKKKKISDYKGKLKV